MYAATAAEMEAQGGCYLYNGQKIPSAEVSYNRVLQAELFKKSCELVGLRINGQTADVRRIS